jgi:hypothetical protein
MARERRHDPDLEWFDHVQARSAGLVVAPKLLKELGLSPLPQTAIDTALVKEILTDDSSKPALVNPWSFFERALGWEAQHVAGAPGGHALPDSFTIALPEHGAVLAPTWAVAELEAGDRPWQLLVRVEKPGIDPDKRGELDGWEATPHQRFERLLRDTGVFAGLLVSERAEKIDDDTLYHPELRLIYAPSGETSGYLTFPLRPMATVPGRPMLAGLKLLLGPYALFNDDTSRRLPALLKKSRDAQAAVSSALAGQVLGALHELLRGLDAAEPALIRELARRRPDHLYEGLLAVLMRLVFILYAEDRDLLPSRADAAQIYETSYSVRGLYAKLVEDAALNPDTMDERRGGWGRLLTLFRLIHGGHPSEFVRARGGKLFDPDEFPFLEGRAAKDDVPRVITVSDGSVLRILEGLMTLKGEGGARERLSYRALDVQQIGSVYETVMGFSAGVATGPVLAIKAGKHNRTPVYVELEKLLAAKGKARVKFLKEEVGRSLSAAQTKPVEVAAAINDLAAALDNIVDERASPRKHIAAGGTPILQPTDERRRTGSHYTPRSLTAPIVKYALEPAFERLGYNATPEQILDLKVCDPAMGSGAFLVEACRAIGERLVDAWTRHKDRKPAIPPDEDERLHARRLVAQRCLYGVDRNPRAVDLARLSLWLATLAKDHEFTFLDHALKCGDTLIGLMTAQITATHWDASKPPTFVGKLVSDHLRDAEDLRAKIRAEAEWATEAELRPILKQADAKAAVARIIGDGVIAAFFTFDQPKKRIEKLVEFQKGVMSHLNSTRWHEALAPFTSSLAAGEHPVRPFHWEIEFPEVFARGNGGFDAIVGNPPFAGKNTIISGNRVGYLPWLQTLHEGAHGNSDLVAHFFRRAFGLLRKRGVFGLIATNTIGQGDTRTTGLTAILSAGGAIARAVRRLKWPGEAAVVVSVVHVASGPVDTPVLDDRPVRRISAYLVEGDLDTTPVSLASNSGKAFQGSILLGLGFTFDDEAAAKGKAETIATMRQLVETDARNATRIFPYIGGEEVNSDPRHAYHRYAIDFFDRPLRRDARLKYWAEMDDRERAKCRAEGIVPADYTDEIAEDWPDLIDILRRRVKPERNLQKRDALRVRWWQYAEKRPGLYGAIKNLTRVIAVSQVSAHFAPTWLNTAFVFDQRLIIFASSSAADFAIISSRAHELWGRVFSSTLEDRLSYNPSTCFRNFPFPNRLGDQFALEQIGATYYEFRAKMMLARSEGLTQIYNRFHMRGETTNDIQRLRELHDELDKVVLHAYRWHDLAERAAPEFIEQDADEGKTPKTRLDWPAEFKDEVLARLLALNTERAADERAAGLIVAIDDDELDGNTLEGKPNYAS